MFKWYFERKAEKAKRNKSPGYFTPLDIPPPTYKTKRVHSTTRISVNGKEKMWVNGKRVDPKAWRAEDTSMKEFEKDMQEFAKDMQQFGKDMRDMFK